MACVAVPNGEDQAGVTLSRLDGLCKRPLLEALLKAVPADACGIVTGEMYEEYDVTLERYLRFGPEAPLPLRAAIDRACEAGGSAVIAGGDCAILAAASAPPGGMRRAIWVRSNEPRRRFTGEEVRFVVGIAAYETVAPVSNELVGGSAAMRRVAEFVAKAGPTGSTVLICGESGTGKELVARSLHRNSPRTGRRFLAVNCAALTETLLESELFGHEKGAFTGAVSRKQGKFEAADGGTIFLDEIGELAPALQPKLLRVLQEREFERVGGTQPIRIDVRMVAATNRDLAQAVKAGTFRSDLYYRLNVVSLAMPPLRARLQDIPDLVDHFLSKHRDKTPRRLSGFSPEALAAIMNYDWPGNVRELENAVEHAIVLGSGALIRPEDLPCHFTGAAPSAEHARITYHEGVQAAKRRLVIGALERASGNHNEAARQLGLHPNNLYRLIRNLNLKTCQ